MVEESSHQGTIGDGVIFGVLVVWYFHAESFYFLKIFFFLRLTVSGQCPETVLDL